MRWTKFLTLLNLTNRSWKCDCGKHTIPPVEIRISRHVIREIPTIARELNLGSRCILVDDANTRKVAGSAVADDLKSERFAVSEVIVEKPDEDNVARVE
jgi:glycerol dehydrogenase-like iron-containing ADH family enzyme